MWFVILGGRGGGGGGLEILQRGTFLQGKGNLRNSDFNQLKSKLT